MSDLPADSQEKTSSATSTVAQDPSSPSWWREFATRIWWAISYAIHGPPKPIDDDDEDCDYFRKSAGLHSDQERADLRKRLDECVDLWIKQYNFGVGLVYWCAYALSLLALAAMLALAEWLHPQSLFIVPVVGPASVITGLTVLALLTTAYERLPADFNAFGYRTDMTFTTVLSFAGLVLSFALRHVVLEPWWFDSAGAIAVVCLAWPVSLVVDGMLFPSILARWLKRLIIAEPLAAIAYGLKELVRLCQAFEKRSSPLRLAERTTAALDLEIAAMAIDRGFCQPLAPQHTSLRGWAKDESRHMASALREFQQDIVLPTRSKLSILEVKAAQALKNALEENWGEFPRVLDDSNVSTIDRREWMETARLVLIAIFPAAGIAILSLLGPTGKELADPSHESIRFWAYLLAAAWCIVNLMRALAPDLDARIASFTAVIGNLSPLSRQDLKK